MCFDSKDANYSRVPEVGVDAHDLEARSQGHDVVAGYLHGFNRLLSPVGQARVHLGDVAVQLLHLGALAIVHVGGVGVCNRYTSS